MSGDVRIWWRDDDAGRDIEKLAPLLDLARRTRKPLGLAVVPAWLRPDAAAEIAAAEAVDVLQHGWDHADHAARGTKKIELGGTLPLAACRDRLRRGRTILARAFGARFLPVLVPPWNRIDGRCLEALGGLGFVGLSTFAGDGRAAAHGLLQVNTHVDLIDWHGGRRMKSSSELRAEVLALLAQPALGTIGLLSHHLDMTPDDMAELERFIGWLDALGRCRWVGPRPLFAPACPLFVPPCPLFVPP